MSQKLIIKRILDETPEQSSFTKNLEINESSVKAQNSSDVLKLAKKKRKTDDDSETQQESKRIHCETAATEQEESDIRQPEPQTSRQNRHLLQAIQLKIVELQNELDAFEHDVEAQEERYFYENDVEHNREHKQVSEDEAEALGFAMCAQETMLFLEREGITSDNILYTRLRDALVGRSQADCTH